MTIADKVLSMQAAKALLATAIDQAWTGSDLGLVKVLAKACIEQGLVPADSRAGFSFSLLAVKCSHLGVAASKHRLYKGGLEGLLRQSPYSLFFALGSKVDNGRPVPAPALLQLPAAVRQPSAEVQAVLDVTWWNGRPPISQLSSGGVAEKVRQSLQSQFAHSASDWCNILLVVQHIPCHLQESVIAMVERANSGPDDASIMRCAMARCCIQLGFHETPTGLCTSVQLIWPAWVKDASFRHVRGQTCYSDMKLGSCLGLPEFAPYFEVVHIKGHPWVSLQFHNLVPSIRDKALLSKFHSPGTPLASASSQPHLGTPPLPQPAALEGSNTSYKYVPASLPVVLPVHMCCDLLLLAGPSFSPAAGHMQPCR